MKLINQTIINMRNKNINVNVIMKVIKLKT